MIELHNIDELKQLPYIQLNNPPLKLLIDTGASKSFLNPHIAKRYYSNYIQIDPFTVSTALLTSSHNTSVTIPAPAEFYLPEPLDFKFYIFHFHDNFDGLIGFDIIKSLNAKLDFFNSRFTTQNAEFLMRYQTTGQPNICQIELSPYTKHIKQIPVNVKNGEVLINKLQIQDCEIPETITNAINNYACVEILNKSDKYINLNFKQPIRVTRFNKQNFEIFNIECSRNKTENISNRIRTNHMNSEEQQAILKLCKEYSDIFYNENTKLTFTSEVKHKIRTKDEIPIYTKSYRYPFIHKPEVDKQINSMLEQNIIRPSNSPWSSPIWIVPKKADASGKKKWRIVVDYRKLNEKTIDDKYPLPNITDVLDKLGKCNYFTTLDLASGYHQVEMHPPDIEKTAFNVENGHYEFLRMPFGLKNAPSTFQRTMDNILRGIQNEFCLVYLDDIIIFSTSLQEHITHIKKVFQRLRETNFKIQLDKSEFLKKEVAYLGHIVTPFGVKPNPDKIRAIKNYPIPKTTKEIKGFLGLLGYYRKFIRDFAKITKPITKCLKKGAQIIHNSEFIQCFETCRNLLINQPLLQYPDFTKEFILTTDASNYAIGAVLSQGEIGRDLPVAYASRTLNESEINYSTIEKELLAVVWATKYFRPYLFGRRFTIVSDHKPLQWLFSLKEPNSKLIRWRLRLEEYDYKIVYKKGKCNKNADALSRIELNTNELENYIQTFNKEMTVQNDTESMQVNLDEAEVIEIPDDDNETVHTNQSENLIVEIPIIDKPLNVNSNQIIFQYVYHSPIKPKIIKIFDKQRIIVQISKNNFNQDIINFVKEYMVPNVNYHLLFEPENIYEPFCEVVRRNFVYPSYKLFKCKTKLEDVERDDDKERIIQMYHESKTNHRGINETEERIKKLYYWPNMKETIRQYINECETCQITKYDRNPPKIQFNITPTATKPFEILHIDLFQIEKQKFLTVIDSFSKYTQAYPVSGSNSVEIANNLLQFISHHNLPSLIISDNGPEFKNVVLQDFFKIHNIQIHFCTPRHPQSNGMIERVHSTLIEHMRILKNKFPNENTITRMKYSIIGYNNSIHSVTKRKPIEIITGHIENDDPLNLNLNERLYSDYVQTHKELTQEMYRHLNEKLQTHKVKVIENRNLTREEAAEYLQGEKAYNKLPNRNKASNLYNPQVVEENKDKIIITQKGAQIHKDQLKRKKK